VDWSDIDVNEMRRGQEQGSRGGVPSVDELLDRAVSAINSGDRVPAATLAGEVLAVDQDNTDAEDLLATSGDAGEIRRLTILFADLVDSTVLSGRVEPETYRVLVGRYREHVCQIVDRYGGHIGSTKGDGLLAMFGHPTAHDNDVRRAVQAGLEITRKVSHLSQQAQRRFGVEIAVRVGVHRGLVYLDTAQDDVYGLAANLAARVSSLAPRGTVVVSEAIKTLVRKDFELEDRPAAPVKGVDGLITHYQVVGERSETVRIWRGPLVGRDREVSRLERSWARAQDGTLTTPCLVFRGESGIGKSRLASVAVDMVLGSRATILELTGSPFHTDVGLHPVRTLIEHRCGIDRSADPAERLRLLGREIRAQGLDPITTVRLLAPVLGIAPEYGYQPAPAEGRKLQELIAAGVGEYLRACLGEGPALLVAEDAHWFDLWTIDVVGALLCANPRRLLVVLTCRPEGWLPDGWPMKVFDLAPLTDEQTDELIVALEPMLNAAQRVAVRERCDGIPFHIEQVVAGLEGSSGGEPAVPEALYEPFVARLNASAKAVPVAEAAAIIGRYVDGPLLRAVSALSAEEVDDVIDELEDAHVLEPFGVDRWRFRHELLREVAAELAPPSVRRGLHARAADALVAGVAGANPDWRVVADHYERAQRFDDAASAYQQVAVDAGRRGAFDEARTYLTHALNGLDNTPTGPQHDRHERALRLQRGFFASAAEGTGSRAAAADFERCLQLRGTERDGDLVATLIALAGYYMSRGDLRRTVQVMESLRDAPDEGRKFFRPVVNSCLAILAWLRGELDAGRRGIDKAIEDFATSDSDEIYLAWWFIPGDPIAEAFQFLGLDCLVRGDLAGARVQLARAAARTDRHGFPEGPWSRGYVSFFEIWVHIEAGQLDDAARLTTEMMERSERYGIEQWRKMGLVVRAAIETLVAVEDGNGDRTASSAGITPHTKLLDAACAAAGIYHGFLESIRARRLVSAGQRDEARRNLDTALHKADNNDEHFYDAERLRIRAHTHVDPDTRTAGFTAAAELARRQGAALFELRATLDDFELRGQPARAALVAAVSRMPTDGAMPEVSLARAALEQADATRS
jgi:class 3 adenylate cyclase/tetratricopeptide (TPR) repeat protein